MNIQKAFLGLGLFTLSIQLFPSKTEKFIFKKTNRALTIQASKKEPPRIAFEELNRMDRTEADEWNTNSPTINLNEKMEEKFSGKTVQILKSRKLVLAALKISRVQSLAQVDDRKWISDLSPQQQKLLNQAQVRSEVLDQDWHIPSWRESLNEELGKIKEDSSSKSESPKVFVSSTDQDGSIKTTSSVHTAGVELNPEPRTTGPTKVLGSVRMAPGLGLGAGQIQVQFQNSRSAQAAPSSQGKLLLAQGVTPSPSKSNFEIQVPNQSGLIVAKLIGANGERLGEGVYRYSPEALSSKASPEIVIQKVSEEVTVHHVNLDREIAGQGSARNYDDRGIAAKTYFASFDTQSKSDATGRSRMEHIALNSWSLVRSEAPQYVPTLNLVSSGDENRLPMMKENFRNALVSLAKDQQKFSSGPTTDSIVWGRALFDGKPASGVEAVVEFQEDVQVVYFNSLMIPDPNLKTTSENGYFAILELPEGMHSIVSRRGPGYFSHANVVTEAGTLTTTTLQASSRLESVELDVFDAFSGTPQSARVEVQSLAEEVEVAGTLPIHLQGIHRLGFMNVRPENQAYLPATYTYSDDQLNLPAPLISEAWLLGIKRGHKVDDVPDTGTIVGFINDQTYEVYLSHEPDFSRNNVVFFDSQGLEKNEATPGGGFVLFNVPSGTQSVVLTSSSSDLVASQVVPVDPKSFRVLNFEF